MGDHIHIVALTSNGLEAKEECIESGMDDFSAKPFDINVLDKQIKALIPH